MTSLNLLMLCAGISGFGIGLALAFVFWIWIINGKEKDYDNRLRRHNKLEGVKNSEGSL